MRESAPPPEAAVAPQPGDPAEGEEPEIMEGE